MNKRNPYSVDRYGEAEAHGTLGRAASMIGCLLAMAVLCLGMLFALWKVSGR